MSWQALDVARGSLVMRRILVDALSWGFVLGALTITGLAGVGVVVSVGTYLREDRSECEECGEQIVSSPAARRPRSDGGNPR